MKSLILIAFVFGLFALTATGEGAPKPLPKDEKDEIKKFDGHWTITGWTQGGGELPKEFLDSTKWSVTGDKYKFEQETSIEDGTIKLDSTKKPATIDLDITSGNDKGKKQLGVYKIEKDVITFCLGRPGDEKRPTDFTSTEDNNNILITLKKGKKDD